jgi:hypothetical protein
LFRSFFFLFLDVRFLGRSKELRQGNSPLLRKKNFKKRAGGKNIFCVLGLPPHRGMKARQDLDEYIALRKSEMRIKAARKNSYNFRHRVKFTPAKRPHFRYLDEEDSDLSPKPSTKPRLVVDENPVIFQKSMQAPQVHEAHEAASKKRYRQGFGGVFFIFSCNKKTFFAFFLAFTSSMSSFMEVTLQELQEHWDMLSVAEQEIYASEREQ